MPNVGSFHRLHSRGSKTRRILSALALINASIVHCFRVQAVSASGVAAFLNLSLGDSDLRFVQVLHAIRTQYP